MEKQKKCSKPPTSHEIFPWFFFPFLASIFVPGFPDQKLDPDLG